MDTPDDIALPRITESIPGDVPCGPDLREDFDPDAPYRKLKASRNDARRYERDGLAGLHEAAPFWRDIRSQAPGVLAERSKDLEIAAWLCESFLREQERPFYWLANGFDMIRELAEQYWDGLYPLPEDEGVLDRLMPVVALNGLDGPGTLVQPIRQTPLVASVEEVPFCHALYDQAVQMDRTVSDPDELQRRIEAGAVTLDTFNAAVRQTPATFYESLVADLAACRTAFQSMVETLDAKAAGEASVPTSNISQALEEVELTALRLGEMVGFYPGGDPNAAGEESVEEEQAGGGGVVAGAPAAHALGSVQTRADALEAVGRIAAFFRETEPHSPLSYGLDQIVRWGRLSLPDLWQELIGDSSERERVFQRVGIESENNDSEY